MSIERQRNSFAVLVEQLISYNNNIIEYLSQLSTLIDSNDATVNYNLTNINDSTITSFSVPSWGYISSELNRLSSNINSLYGIDNGNTQIQTANNIWKRVILTDVNREPRSISSLPQIIRFTSLKNNFFDNLVDPNLAVSFDLSNLISDDVTELLSRRYIVNFAVDSNGQLTIDGENAIQEFNNTYRGFNNIDYTEFNTWLTTTPGVLPTNGFDEERIKILPMSLRYTGSFSVVRIDEDSVNKTIWFVLNTIEYVDNQLNSKVSLAIGDNLALNTDSSSTVYKVTQISTTQSLPRVKLERVSGNDPIPVGLGVLKIYSTTISNKSINITIGYNERNVLFLKTINKDNIISNNWSLGSGFFTNELTLLSNNSDNNKSLIQYYNERVSDYGKVLKDLVDTKQPLSEALVPNIPTLISDNFRVVQINTHLTNTADSKAISDRYGALTGAKSRLGSINAQLDVERAKLRTSGFASDSRSYNLAQAKIDDLLNKKISISKEISSINNEIISLSTSLNTAGKSEPKYRLRGIFNFPVPKIGGDGNVQEVIQFIYRYRYLSNSGKTANIETISVLGDDGVSTNNSNAVFSEWVTVKTDVRARSYDSVNNVWRWEVVDVSDANTPNINQVDIPIQRGERIEIQVKSISEVGYPDIIVESPYSESLIKDFPQDLTTITDSMDSLFREATLEESIVRFKEDMPNLEEHLNDQVIIGNNVYYHLAKKMLTENQDTSGNNLDVQQVINMLFEKIRILEEKIEIARGVLRVFVYRKNSEFLIKNDMEIPFNIECEDYATKYVNDANVTGRVYENNIYVVKDFYIKIQNFSASSPLGLSTNRIYNSDRSVYNNSAPQSFWVNERDELVYSNEVGSTRTQLDNQFLWQLNYDTGNVTSAFSKISENVGNNFLSVVNNSITNVLSTTEYNVGYGENSLLEFSGNNNSLLETKKWVDTSVSVASANKLLTTVHPSIQTLNDIIDNNSQKTRIFQPQEEITIPINIYFKLNSIDPNTGSGKDYKYIDFNNIFSTTKHIKKVKFMLENVAENKPFVFKIKFTINRSKVVVQKVSDSNNTNNNDVSRNNFLG